MSSASHQAASSLAGLTNGAQVCNTRGTDLYGFATNPRTASTLTATMEQVALKNNVQAVKVPLEDGRIFVGFTYRPAAVKPVLAAQGRTMQVLGGAAEYGQKPLYGGSWSCVGNECLKMNPLGRR